MVRKMGGVVLLDDGGLWLCLNGRWRFGFEGE